MNLVVRVKKRRLRKNPVVRKTRNERQMGTMREFSIFRQGGVCVYIHLTKNCRTLHVVV